jgi:hypothetical protein
MHQADPEALVEDLRILCLLQSVEDLQLDPLSMNGTPEVVTDVTR